MTEDRGDFGRRRPEWGFAERAGRVALASVLVLSVAAAGTWWIYSDVDARFVLVVLAAGALAVAATWWLGSMVPSAAIAASGVIVMLVAAPIWVGYAVLAERGQTVVAEVSRVDTSSARNGLDYSVWLTDPAGRPIARPLLTYGPPQPLEVGDTVRVLADPRGQLDTEPLDRDFLPWMLLVMIAGAVLLVVGLAIAARGSRPDSGGGSRRGSGGRTSRRASDPTRRAPRPARGRRTA